MAKKPATEGSKFPATCNQTELAHILGIAPRNVRDWAQRGVLVKATTKGRYQTLPSIQAYISHLRESAAGRATSGGKTLADEKAAQVRVQTEISEMKLAALRGEMLTLSDVRASWSQFALAVRSTVLSLPTSARSVIPHLTAHDGETLKRLCRDKLTDLAKEVEAIVIEGDPSSLRQ